MTTTQTAGVNGKATKKSRRNEVGGFLVERVRGETMRAFVASRGMEIDTDVTDEQLGVALALFFKANTPAGDLVRCDVCDGVSSADLAACPFCGDQGEVDGGDAEQEPAPVPAKAAPESAPEVIVEPPAESLIEDLSEVHRLAEDPPKPKKQRAPKAAKTPKESTAIVKATTSAIASSSELDAAVAEVRKLKAAGVVAFWELGKKILSISESGLWKLRVGEDGSVRYKSFEAFAFHELKMSAAHAYSAMECARGYDDEVAVREIGSTSKAVLLLKAAPPDREALKEKVKAGATVKELTRDVAESRKRHGSPKADTQHSKAGARSAEKKASEAKASEKISVTAIVGSKTIKLYKRPDTMKGLDMGSLARAKRIADQPFGRYEMANGLVQYFSVIQKEDGELVLKIETRRED